MLVEKENSISLWTSPPDIPGAIKDKHRNAGWTAIGEERDSYGNPMPTFSQKLIKGKEFIKSRQMAYAGEDAPGLWGCSQEFYPTMLNFILTIERAKAEGIEPKRALASAGVIESTSISDFGSSQQTDCTRASRNINTHSQKRMHLGNY